MEVFALSKGKQTTSRTRHGARIGRKVPATMPDYGSIDGVLRLIRGMAHDLIDADNILIAKFKPSGLDLGRFPAKLLLATMLYEQFRGYQFSLTIEQLIIVILLALFFGYRLAVRDGNCHIPNSKSYSTKKLNAVKSVNSGKICRLTQIERLSHEG
jgi:hypothetical protein